TINFTGMEKLGGGGDDVFTFTPAGTLSGGVDGGPGQSRIDLSTFSAITVTLTGLGAVNGFDGTISTGPVASFTNLSGVDASLADATDKLGGAPVNAAWTLTSAGGGTIKSATSNATFACANVEFLVGGSANDTFAFAS